MSNMITGIVRLGNRSAMLVLLLLAAPVTMAEEQDLRSIVEANFEAADTDGDGRLGPDEFRSLIDANAEKNIGRAAMVKRFGAYERAFATADRDGDGSVVWPELVTNQAQRGQ